MVFILINYLFFIVNVRAKILYILFISNSIMIKLFLILSFVDTNIIIDKYEYMDN